jgi:hypothetical protein
MNTCALPWRMKQTYGKEKRDTYVMVVGSVLALHGYEMNLRLGS